MGAGHDHGGQLQRAADRHRGRLWAALGVLVTLMVVEAGAALFTGSLALLSDAGHMLTDAAGIVIALSASLLATRPEIGKAHV